MVDVARLQDLAGKEISAISLGRDYVELLFDVSKLSATAGAEVAHFVPSRHGRLEVANMVVYENLYEN